MLKKISDVSVKIIQNILPDPFIFCVVLTIVVFIAAMPATGAGPLAIATAWGAGIWNLLAFSMQMALVLVLGNAMATAPAIKKLLDNLASKAHTPAQAIIFVTVVGTIASWLNWGFGLVVGALFAKSLAKKVKGVDYRLLIASAYSGFVVWHAGISGSIPLTISAAEGFTISSGVAYEQIGMSETVFSPWNLIICLVILIIMPVFNAKMHPAPEEVISVDPKLLVEEEVTTRKASTIAEKLEDSRILSLVVVVLGVVYLIQYFMSAGNILNSLSLNVVNLIFLVLGVLLHGTPLNYVKAISNAAGGAAGIILQFPFYAGIQAMMVFCVKDADGVAISSSLAGVISNFFVSISNNITFPVWTFLSAGIVNFFVPSGGGQWAVQSPIVLPACDAMGISKGIGCMAIAWGDAWTNLLQPFWALPALGIAGLGARDIMGYCVVDLLLTGVIVIVGFILVGILI